MLPLARPLPSPHSFRRGTRCSDALHTTVHALQISVAYRYWVNRSIASWTFRVLLFNKRKLFSGLIKLATLCFSKKILTPEIFVPSVPVFSFWKFRVILSPQSVFCLPKLKDGHTSLTPSTVPFVLFSAASVLKLHTLNTFRLKVFKNDCFHWLHVRWPWSLLLEVSSSVSFVISSVLDSPGGKSRDSFLQI